MDSGDIQLDDPGTAALSFPSEQADDHEGSEEGPSQYEYVRPADWTATQAEDGSDEEDESDEQGHIASVVDDHVTQEQLADADETGDDGDMQLSQQDVEAIVASQMRTLERDYAASIEVDISQPVQLRQLPPRLAELAARNPAVAARFAQARASAQAASAETRVPPPEWESFEFPDDYDELQAADAAALRDGSGGAGAVVDAAAPEGAGGTEWASAQSKVVFGTGIRPGDPFEPFEGVPPSSAAALQPLKLPKLKFVGTALAAASAAGGKGKGVVAAASATVSTAHAAGKRVPAPVPRAVSPLSSHARAEIAQAMARVRVQPLGHASRMAEQIVQAALAKAAAMKGQGQA